MPVQNPVIVIPGITASELRDEYPVTPDVVWSALLNKEYDRITLHPDDLRYELKEPSRVAANAAFKMPYGELISELRHNLTDRADRAVPVYPFAYDWRIPLEHIEARLEAFVDEVIARTALIPHYHRAGYTEENGQVDLVGHSMGGLVIAGYLERKRKAARVHKVATLGTPFRGSFEAPIKVATGTAALGEAASASREREAARLTPALYHLVPQWPGAVSAERDLGRDLFRVGTWQRGVIRTLQEYIRIHALEGPRRGPGLEQRAERLLGDMLRIARRHRRRIERFALADAGLDASRWLAVVGVDSRTRVGLDIRKDPAGEPEFDLSGEARRNRWESNDVNQRVETGDGTVPYMGAKPAFLDTANLVCVRPDDFGYWEIADRAILGAVGFHGLLPKLNLVHRLVVSHFRGRAGKGIWGWSPPDLVAAKWSPPIRNLQDRSA